MTARWLAAAFVLYGLLATALLAIILPPFQNPDETVHFLRAAQIAGGGLVGTRFRVLGADGSQRVLAGGLVDPALLQAWAPISALKLHPQMLATRAMWAPNIHWSGDREMLQFPSSAVYPPLFYAPAAIGVIVGRVTRMTVVQTLVLSRLLTGIAAVAVAAVAIAYAGGAAAWLFAILTLPMSLSMIASLSQDALLLACSALAGALLVQEFRRPGHNDGKMLAGLAVSLALVATARPPYAALAALPLGLGKVRLQTRALVAVAIVASVLAWSGLAAAMTFTNFAGYVGADPAEQMGLLWHEPLRVLAVAWATLAQHWRLYLDGFIGRLGSDTIELPPDYHSVAWTVLAVAAAAAMLGLRGDRISARSRLLIVVALALSAAGVFAITYVVWTAPGGATVEGVQGRYFLPLALFATALLPALGDTRWARLHDALVLVVAAFPVVSLAVVMRAVVLRYYLG